MSRPPSHPARLYNLDVRRQSVILHRVQTDGKLPKTLKEDLIRVLSEGSALLTQVVQLKSAEEARQGGRSRAEEKEGGARRRTG